jgi:predicted Zn-dependent protease
MESKVSKKQIQQELRSRWKDRAVQAALRGEWDEAVQNNLEILEMFPDDVKARNRLGKAYFELGQHEQAATAYEDNLQRQPSNPIARRRLTELYALVERPQATDLEVAAEESADAPDDSIEDDISLEGADD